MRSSMLKAISMHELTLAELEAVFKISCGISDTSHKIYDGEFAEVYPDCHDFVQCLFLSIYERYVDTFGRVYAMEKLLSDCLAAILKKKSEINPLSASTQSKLQLIFKKFNPIALVKGPQPVAFDYPGDADELNELVRKANYVLFGKGSTDKQVEFLKNSKRIFPRFVVKSGVDAFLHYDNVTTISADIINLGFGGVLCGVNVARGAQAPLGLSLKDRSLSSDVALRASMARVEVQDGDAQLVGLSFSTMSWPNQKKLINIIYNL